MASDKWADFEDDFPHVVKAARRLDGVVHMLYRRDFDSARASGAGRVYEVSKRLRGLMNMVRDLRRTGVHDGHCTTCGTPVEVVSTDEGTSYYRPKEADDGE